MNPEPRPPRLAEWILKRVVPPGVVGESILGDLRESFSEAIQSRGPLRARAYYWTDLLRIAIHRPRHTGGVHAIPERRHNGRWLEALTPDVRLAVRMLIKSPLLTVVGGLGLAVGIAVSIGFFTFLKFYYSDPPVEDGDRVVMVGDLGDGDSTLFDYQVWKDGLQSIEDLAAYRTVDRDLQGPTMVSGSAEVAEMTASAFRVARVSPLLGRPLLDSDEVDGAPRVVVIGYREWHQRLGADPAVVGRQIRLDGMPHTVVGVMPEDFRLPVDHGFWTPLVTGTVGAGTGGGAQIWVFGRLAPGVEAAAAQAEVAVIGARMSAESPNDHERRRPVVLPYIRQVLDIQDVPAWQIWLAQVFGGLILIVVGVNVAVLFYARTARRRVEIIVRTAMGASRSRIVTQLFLEALALSAVAAALGLLIAQVGFRQLTLVADFQGDLPYWLLGGLPPETVLYAAGLAALTAVVVGALPALQATGRHLQSTLREMGGGTGLRIGRTWTVLICVQVAIAVGVLPALVGIAWTYTPPPTPTFPASEILGFRLPHLSPLRGAADSGQSAADAGYGSLQAELLRRVEAIPEVAGVTFTTTSSGVRIEVEDPTGTLESKYSGSIRIDVKYFGVFGVPVVAGRAFDEDDAAEGATTAIVNRAFVDEHFAGGSAVGRRFREVPAAAAESNVPSAGWFTVIGVVENMVRPEGPRAYHPMALGTEPLRLAARTRGIDAASIAPRVREISAVVAPGSSLSVFPLSYDGDPTELRLILSMVGLATLSVLLLSAAGISAMMSFAVTQRRREIGIRTALGASRRQVLASIFLRSTRQLGIGLLVGAAGAALLDRLAGGEMLNGEVGPLLALVAAIMLLSGLLATLGPARRALRIQPTDALREE
jgi:predicted permease